MFFYHRRGTVTAASQSLIMIAFADSSICLLVATPKLVRESWAYDSAGWPVA